MRSEQDKAVSISRWNGRLVALFQTSKKEQILKITNYNSFYYLFTTYLFYNSF